MADKNTEVTEQEANALGAKIFGDGNAVGAELENEQPTVGVEEENAGSTDSLPDSGAKQIQDESSAESDEVVSEEVGDSTQQGVGENASEEETTENASNEASDNSSEQLDADSNPKAEQTPNQGANAIPADEGSSDYEEVDPVDTGMTNGKVYAVSVDGSESGSNIEISTLSKEEFNSDVNNVISATSNVNAAYNSVKEAFETAKKIKGYKKSAREERKQAIDSLKQSISEAEKTIIAAESSITILNSAIDSPILDTTVTEDDKKTANNVINTANKSITNVRSLINDSTKWQKRRAVIKGLAWTGVGLGAVALVGSIGEIPEAWGNGYYQFARTASENNGNLDTNTNIIIDVDSMDVIRIQNVLDKVLGNSTINVEGIKSIQVDSENNYHLILDADKKGTDCLIDVNMGEQNGFSDATMLIDTLMNSNLTKDKIDTYYELSSFVGADAKNAIAVGLEQQLGSIGSTNGGIWAKGSYSINRTGKTTQYGAKVDYLVFDESGIATKIDGAVTATSTNDFKNSLWDVVYFSYGGPNVDFSGKISQEFTKSTMSKASVSIVNSTGTVAVSTGVDLVR